MATERHQPDVIFKEGKAFNNDSFFIAELLFNCPIDYGKPNNEENSITLSFKLVYGDKPCNATGGHRIDLGTIEAIRSHVSQQKVMVYLCGGPGDINPPCRIPELNRFFLKQGYWILYPDYRGTGDSSSQDIIRRLKKRDGSALRMVKQLGQRNIVRDIEAVRVALQEQGTNKWSICAQSYGGWISYSYLSFSYTGLQRVCINAGLTPISHDPAHVHRQLFRNLIERNEAYYKIYPDDVSRVTSQAIWLASQNNGDGVEIPGWGRLTAKQFLCLGRSLSSKAKFSHLHELFLRISKDSIVNGESASLTDEAIELYKATDNWRFDKRPLYAVLNESQYLRRKDDDPTRWVAQRVASEPEFVQYFWWVNCAAGELKARLSECKKVYFSGEMIYPFFFDNYDALKPFKGVAMELAEHRLEEDSYDLGQIKGNKVPVTAVFGSHDVIVDPGLSRDTCNNTGNMMVREIPGKEHGAIRSDAVLILGTHSDLMEF